MTGCCGTVGRVLTPYFAETGTAPAFLVLILVFSINRGFLSRLLSFRALVYLGEISFAVYLIHWPIERFVEERHLIADPVLRVTVVAVAVIALAALAFHWVERPANRLARRKLMPARRAAATRGRASGCRKRLAGPVNGSSALPAQPKARGAGHCDGP